MPKAKLKINVSEIKKVKVAAEFSGVVVVPNSAKQIGQEAHLTLSTPSTSNYIEFGRLLATVSGNELDGEVEAAKPASKPKAEKA